MKKPVLFTACIVITIITLSIVQISVSNSLSTTGIGLLKIEKQVKQYRKENALLSQRILELSSYTRIASQASEMGFIEEKSQMAVTGPLPIASKP